jgi:hypothetical protein
VCLTNKKMLLQKRKRGFFKAFINKTILLVFLSSAQFSLFSQITLSIQDFETPAATPEMTYTNTNGALYTGLSGGGERPANSPFYSSFETAFGAQNTNATVTFMNNTDLDNCSEKYFEFRLGAFSVNTNGNGMDATDNVLVAVSLDGGTTWSNELRVDGFNNACWGYDATGLASAIYDGDNNPAVFQPAGGALRTTDGYSTVRVNLPNAATQARLRITLLNNATNERWVIDDVKLMAASCSCAPTTEPTTNVSNINVSANCTDATIDYTLGDGDFILVVMSETCPIASDPIDQTSYNAESIYGLGEQIGAGNYVVYNGSANSFSVTGLTGGTNLLL